jgi:AbrB family looped-hinge helix DNA binding protein
MPVSWTTGGTEESFLSTYSPFIRQNVKGLYLVLDSVSFDSKIMPKAKISARGQIALPKVVRDQLGLADGTSVVMALEGETVILRKLPEGSWQ